MLTTALISFEYLIINTSTHKKLLLNALKKYRIMTYHLYTSHKKATKTSNIEET